MKAVIRKISLLVLLTMVATVAIAGCSNSTTTATPSATTAAKSAATSVATTPTKAAATQASTTAAATKSTSSATTPSAAKTPAASGTAATTSSGVAVSGLVTTPTTFTVDQLKGMATKITANHPKKGPTDYQGVRLSKILETVKVSADAKTIVVVGADGYKAEVSMTNLKASADSMIAIDDSGALSTVMPDMDTGTWVRDLVKIEVK